MFGNVAVIFGGASNENEISVITGTMAANVLKGGGERVVAVYITKDGDFYTGDALLDIANFKGEKYKALPRAHIADGGVYVLNRRGKTKKFIPVDVALNCCHGGLGEGGGLCGLCGMAKIPLAGAGIFESAAFMDKYITKLVLSALGVKCAPYTYVTQESSVDGVKLPEYPVIVKPVSLGSSIGVERADNAEELGSALQAAFVYDSAAIVEKYIESRREINCAAYFADGRVTVSECEEASSDGEILSFDDKYTGGGRSVFPAKIPKKLSDNIKRTTADVYTRLNMRGIVRFDYILSGDTVYLSEINTVPGSLSYYLLSGGFKDFYPVLCAVLSQAKSDAEKGRGKKLLSTGILENLPPVAPKLRK